MRRTRFRRMAVHKYLLLMMGFLIFGMGIGYAAISQTLEIDGTTDIDSSSWDVHFANVLVSDGSVAADTPTITDSTSVSFSVNLDNPGDFYEFKIDVKNDGTMNSKIDSYQVLPVLTAEQQEFFEIFFFKNFQNPFEEVGRFVASNSSNLWKNKAGKSYDTREQRRALAELWKQKPY